MLKQKRRKNKKQRDILKVKIKIISKELRTELVP